MQAFVSGQAGVALLVDGEKLASLHADRPDEMVSRSRRDIPFLFRDVTDLEVFEGVNVQKATARLDLATAKADALQLTLLLLDPELSADIRQEAATELTDLLARPEVTEWVESVLYSQAVPADGDLAGALGLCPAGPVRNLLLRLQNHQDAITTVSHAWNQIPLRVFGSSDERSGALAVAVREGLFRDLVLSGAEHSSLEQFRLKSYGNRPFSRVRNHRDILREWLASFQAGSSVAESRRRTFDTESDSAEEQSEELSTQGAKEILERVEKQKAAIVGLMRARDLDRARQYLADLIEDQLRSGEPVHACKSLCDLAKKARDLGLYRFQLELTSQAVTVKNDDGWAWAQHGDALLQAGTLGPALEAYDRALTYVNAPHARTGRAEVLKAQNRLPEALAAYEVVIAEFPENVVARNGRAEVLKALNRLPEALAAYEDIIAGFPENVVARNGRAEVLKALNRLTEALAAYVDVIADFPSDVVARTGRAEVLKAQNRLPEALAAYEVVIADFPSDLVARTGRAEVLKAQNRLPEALAAYEVVIADFPSDVVARNGCAGVLSALGRFEEALARLPSSTGLPVTKDEWTGFHIRAMVLLQMGKAKEATRILRRGIAECPRPAQRAYFQTGLALVQIRQRAFAEAGSTLEGLEEEASLAAPATVLRFHAFGAAGNRERASKAAERLTAFEHVVGVLEVGRELRRRFLDGAAPLQTDEWLLQKEANLLLAA
jgi:tetratricopeptide (TPR) repeat protein